MTTGTPANMRASLARLHEKRSRLKIGLNSTLCGIRCGHSPVGGQGFRLFTLGPWGMVSLEMLGGYVAEAMSGFSPGGLALAAVVVFAAGFLRGFTGFGFS